MIEHLIGALQAAADRGATSGEKLRHLDGIEAVMETHFRYLFGPSPNQTTTDRPESRSSACGTAAELCRISREVARRES